MLLQIISEGCIIVRIDPQSNLWEIRLIANVTSIQISEDVESINQNKQSFSLKLKTH